MAAAGTAYDGAVTTAADIFGASGRLADGISNTSAPKAIDYGTFTGGFQFDALVCIVLVLFLYIVYNYSPYIKTLFSAITRKNTPSDKLMDEQNQYFRQFITLSLLLGALVIAGIITKTAGMYVANGDIPPSHHIPPEWTCWLAAGIALPVTLYKVVFIRMARAVTGNNKFFEEHHSMSRSFFAGAAVVVCPLFLLLAFARGSYAEALLYACSGAAGIMYLRFLFKSLGFFRERNVSILQWFLYLCAVEFFPLSFIVLWGLRNV